MSYILDALRKAEAERERGTVPGIHAQPVRQASAEAAARARVPAWVWAVVGACVLLAGLLVWQMMGRGGEAAAPAVSAAAPPVVATAPPVATLPAIGTPPAVAAAGSSASVETAPEKNPAASMAPPSSGSISSAASAPVPSTAAASKAPPVPAIAAALREAAPAVRKPAPAASAVGALPGTSNTPSVAPGAAPTTAAPQPVPPAIAQKPPAPLASNPAGAQPTEPHVYAVNELPDDIRRQLPVLSVSGSMYSAVPANRLVIFNGQVFHEGDKVTTDLVLEQIRPKAAVLRYKTYRYQLTY